MAKVNVKDWNNLPIEQWNTTTIHAFLIDETDRKYSAEYVPGGKGPKSQRWSMEKGMIKRELTKKGPEVVKAFIEVCWDEYFTPNKKKYPYPNFGFMMGYMDKFWSDARRKVEKEEMFDKAVDNSEDIVYTEGSSDGNDVSNWF